MTRDKERSSFNHVDIDIDCLLTVERTHCSSRCSSSILYVLSGSRIVLFVLFSSKCFMLFMLLRLATTTTTTTTISISTYMVIMVASYFWQLLYYQ